MGGDTIMHAAVKGGSMSVLLRLLSVCSPVKVNSRYYFNSLIHI